MGFHKLLREQEIIKIIYIFIQRKGYIMALMRCPDCGKMVSGRAEVCPNCGCPSSYFEEGIIDEGEVKEEEIVEEKDDEIKIDEEDDGLSLKKLDGFSILGQEKYYDESQKLYIDMMKLHNRKAALYEKELEDRYAKAKTMEKVWEEGTPWVEKIINNTVNENVKILYEYDIYIRTDEFKKKFNINYWDKIKGIVDAYDSVIHEANEYQQMKEYERAGRGRWQGGGFGLRGAISGAIKAGMLNAVTDAGRAIGDSIVDSRDNSKVAQATQRLYNAEETKKELCDGLRRCILQADMGLAVLLKDKGITSGIDEDINAAEKWAHARQYEKNSRKLAVKAIEALYGFPLRGRVLMALIINDIIPELISDEEENSIDDLLRFMKFWDMQDDFSQFFSNMEKRKLVSQYLENHKDYRDINFSDYKPCTYVKLKSIKKEIIQVIGSDSLPQLVPFCVHLDNFFKECLDTEFCLSSAETILQINDGTTADDFIDKIHNEKLELDGLLKEVWVKGDEKKIPDVKIKNKWKLPETDTILMYQNEAVFGTMFGGKGFVLTNSLLCNLNPSMAIPLSQISDIKYDDMGHAINVCGEGSEIIIDLNSEKPATRRFLYSCLEIFLETYYMSQEERHMRFVKRCAKRIWEIMGIYATENNLSEDDTCDLLIRFLIRKGIIKEKSQTIFCSYCGKKIKRTIKFCNYCGKANKNG